MEEQEAASTSAESEADSKPISAVEVTPVDPNKILTKKDIMEKMNAMLAEKKGDSDAPAKLMAFKLSIKSGVLNSYYLYMHLMTGQQIPSISYNRPPDRHCACMAQTLLGSLLHM